MSVYHTCHTFVSERLWRDQLENTTLQPVSHPFSFSSLMNEAFACFGGTLQRFNFDFDFDVRGTLSGRILYLS
jgi:hypothetical protein